MFKSHIYWVLMLAVSFIQQVVMVNTLLLLFCELVLLCITRQSLNLSHCDFIIKMGLDLFLPHLHSKFSIKHFQYDFYHHCLVVVYVFLILAVQITFCKSAKYICFMWNIEHELFNLVFLKIILLSWSLFILFCMWQVNFNCFFAMLASTSLQLIQVWF